MVKVVEHLSGMFNIPRVHDLKFMHRYHCIFKKCIVPVVDHLYPQNIFGVKLVG